MKNSRTAQGFTEPGFTEPGFTERRWILGVLLASLPFLAIPGAHGQDSQTSSSGSGTYTTPYTRALIDPSYAASPGTAQAIPLTQGAGAQQSSESQLSVAGPELHREFLYGGTVSTVYMDSYNTAAIGHIVSGVASPYVSLYLPTRTGGVTLQYLGTYAPDDAFTSTFQAYHTLSFNAVGAFTRRWYWGLTSSGNYGSATAQFEGPLTYMLIGLVPVVDPVAPGSLFLGRTVAFAQNAAKLGWQRSPRDRIELLAYHTYSDLSASSLSGGLPADRSNGIGSKLDYSREVASRFRFDVYAQEEHAMKTSCNMYGGGVGMSAQLSSSWHLDVSGGPEWTSPNCGSQTNLNFYGALVKALRGQAKVYAVAWQHYNLAFQTTNTFQDAAAVGFSQPLGSRFTVEGSAGYFKVDPLLVSAQSYQGYFVAPLIRSKLSDNLFLSGGYRVSHPTGGNTVAGNLNFATISLEWRPKPFALGR
jgi:hypothetical protein